MGWSGLWIWKGKKGRERGKTLYMLTKGVGRDGAPSLPHACSRGLGSGNGTSQQTCCGQGRVRRATLPSETLRFFGTSEWTLVCPFFCLSGHHSSWSITEASSALTLTLFPLSPLSWLWFRWSPAQLSVLAHLLFLYRPLDVVSQCESVHTAPEAWFVPSLSLQWVHPSLVILDVPRSV